MNAQLMIYRGYGLTHFDIHAIDDYVYSQMSDIAQYLWIPNNYW